MLASPAATVRSVTGMIERLGPDVVDAFVTTRRVIDSGHRRVTFAERYLMNQGARSFQE
jgi:hypothetical protein